MTNKMMIWIWRAAVRVSLKPQREEPQIHHRRGHIALHNMHGRMWKWMRPWAPTKRETPIGLGWRSTLMHTTRVKLSGQIDLFAPVGQQFHQNLKNGHVAWPKLRQLTQVVQMTKRG
jgi:hypothetical protein